MKPGRDLDVIIAERVMGWSEITVLDYATVGRGPNGEHAMPSYSTDIRAAWQVVDAIRYKHGGGLLELYRNGNDTWAARFDEDARLSTEDTPAHAICIAALEALRFK